MPITLESVVCRTAGLPSAPLDDQIVILNLANNKYIGLDEIGSRVWDLLSAPVSVNSLSRMISLEYRGDASEIKSDLMAFVDQLKADGLVSVTDPTGD
jgi:hypothetical protein